MSNFTKTTSITAFCQANNISKIEILLNAKTGKRFIATDNGMSMRVAEKLTKLDAKTQISWFTPEEGEPSYMAHNKGVGAEVLSSFSIGAPAKQATPADIEDDVF